MIALATADAIVQIWSIDSVGAMRCKVTSQLNSNDGVKSLRFASDGRQLLVLSLLNGNMCVVVLHVEWRPQTETSLFRQHCPQQ